MLVAWKLESFVMHLLGSKKYTLTRFSLVFWDVSSMSDYILMHYGKTHLICSCIILFYYSCGVPSVWGRRSALAVGRYFSLLLHCESLFGLKSTLFWKWFILDDLMI